MSTFTAEPALLESAKWSLRNGRKSIVQANNAEFKCLGEFDALGDIFSEDVSCQTEDGVIRPLDCLFISLKGGDGS